jgi:hypothetical protein
MHDAEEVRLDRVFGWRHHEHVRRELVSTTVMDRN